MAQIIESLEDEFFNSLIDVLSNAPLWEKDDSNRTYSTISEETWFLIDAILENGFGQFTRSDIKELLEIINE